jgi:hypothetical protein
MPTTKRLASMARSYRCLAKSFSDGCPAITSDLASIVCLPSRMASCSTSSHISSSIKSFSDIRQNCCRF